jgi:hypothetical protein
LALAGLVEMIGKEHIFVDLHSAVLSAEEISQNYLESNPLALRDCIVI